MTTGELTTLGFTTQRRVTHSEDHLIARGFLNTATVAIPEGTVVKLDTANPYCCKPVTAVTDIAIGTVSAGSTITDGVSGHITINTYFQIIAKATCKGAIAIGDKLAAYAIDTATSSLQQYKKAVAGDTVVGLALTAGASDHDIIDVGVFRISSVYGSSTPAAHIADSAYTPLSAIAASYADEAAARTSVNTLKTETATALTYLEGKINAILAAMQTAGLMA